MKEINYAVNHKCSNMKGEKKINTWRLQIWNLEICWKNIPDSIIHAND